jgi:hypothetical protein
MFVTTINGDIGSNIAEESGMSTITPFARISPSILAFDFTTNIPNFNDGFRGLPFEVFDTDSNVPFGISFDSTSAGRIAMTNFIEDKEAGDLSSFSFLTADKLLKNKGKIWSGVVSDDGLLLTPFDAGYGFEVSITTTSNQTHSKTFEVVVKNGDNGDKAIQDATVIVFPEYFASEGERTEYPKDVGQVAIGTDGWKAEPGKAGKFSVKIGKVNDFTLVGRRFGFNFLVLANGLDNPNVKHGYVHGVAESSLFHQEHTLDGLEVGPQDVNFNSITKNFVISDLPSKSGVNTYFSIAGDAGSVRVKFATPFDALPSVIVTPVVSPDSLKDKFRYASGFPVSVRSSAFGGFPPQFQVPKCLVETITKTDCHIKCGMVLLKEPALCSAGFFVLKGEYTLPCILNFPYYVAEYTPLPFNIVVVGPSASDV